MNPALASLLAKRDEAVKKTREQEARIRPVKTRTKIDLKAVKKEKEIDQSVADILGTLDYPTAEGLYWNEFGKREIISRAHLASLGLLDDAFELIGKQWGVVKKGLASMLGNFRAKHLENLERMYTGYYEYTPEGKSQLVKKPPVIVETKVTPTEVKMARSIAATTRLTTVLETKTVPPDDMADEELPQEKAQSQTTRLRGSNDLDLPVEGIYAELGQNLILAIHAGELSFLWDVMAMKLKKENFNATGVSHLYYAYRVANIDASTTIVAEMKPWDYFWDNITDLPWRRQHIEGLTKHSTWRDAGPVPSHVIIGNMITDWGIGSLSGAFPKKVVSVAKNCKFYGSSANAPDPNGGSEVIFTPSSEYYRIKVDCVWSPPDYLAGGLNCSTICVPISHPDQVLGVIEKFCVGDGFRVAATFGSNPLLWVQKNGKLTGPQVRAVAERAALAALWIPIYNLSNFLHGGTDIWRLEINEEIVASEVTTLNCQVYVPLQTRMPKYNRTQDWKIPELCKTVARAPPMIPPPDRISPDFENMDESCAPTLDTQKINSDPVRVVVAGTKDGQKHKVRRTTARRFVDQ